ncbi:MAG: L-histidine N(alpha)-methyltransferase [Bacteroidota bacterium]
MAEGESICTEYSYKYSIDDFRSMAASEGLTLQHVWTDEDGLFSVQLYSTR